jgi:hypothetical protein
LAPNKEWRNTGSCFSNRSGKDYFEKHQQEHDMAVQIIISIVDHATMKFTV